MTARTSGDAAESGSPVASVSVDLRSGPDAVSVALTTPAGVLAVPFPVHAVYLDGTEDRFGYEGVHDLGDGRWNGVRDWARDGFHLRVSDTWSPAERGVVLHRHLTVDGDSSRSPDGIQLRLAVDLPDGEPWRYGVPAMVYSPGQYDDGNRRTFVDARLSYPLVVAHRPGDRSAVTLLRATTATTDAAPLRRTGQSRFLQRTDLGSIGFAPSDRALLAAWPYAEEDRSALLDATGTPAVALHPVERMTVDLEYRILCGAADTFAAAVSDAFGFALQLTDPQPAALPFSLEDSVELRATSLARTYHEWDSGGAGFLQNFDPERGYSSQAKAFGASFTTHGMSGSRGILEYGFTGRQLNAAYVLAERYGAEWLTRSARVADFFVDTMTTPSGWLYTLYSLDKRRPLFSCGDPDGPVMHYLGTEGSPGAYTRMMSEAASDLLLMYQLHARRDDTRPGWLAACRRFAAFLLAVQGADGSWLRAYTPESDPVTGAWAGAGDEAKASSAAPVPFLLALAEELGDTEPEEAMALRAAAERAGRYILAAQVAVDEFRGGTLDNPNVVDKEAALLGMAALLRLAEVTENVSFLAGARRAGQLAVTWHHIWDVPNLPGTPVGRAQVRSTGWGAINSIWGAGVTDIYSLFFLADLVTLSRRTGDPLFASIAHLVAAGCQQILSHPGDRFGFADVGMQPEGIAFCDQGADDGLIRKGDTWGGLGWIYTAGTFGLGRYLAALSSRP